MALDPARALAAGERADALQRLQNAVPVLDVLRTPGSHYIFKFNYAAADAAGDHANGFLQQAWQSDTQWIWTAQLGDLPMDRLAKGHDVVTTQGPLSLVPLREQMLRGAILTPEGDKPLEPNAALRIATGHWQSAAVTCVLVAPAGFAAPSPERAPQEQMFCTDAGGRLVLASPVPGYTVAYAYAGPAPASASAIAIAEAGTLMLDAKLEFALPLTASLPMVWLDGGGGSAAQAKDALDASADSMALKRCRSCLATMNDTDNEFQRTSTLAGPEILWRSLPAPSGVHLSAPAMVVVHASLAPDGTVNDSETWGAADAPLIDAAQALLRKNPFGKSSAEREVFLGVQFAAR